MIKKGQWVDVQTPCGAMGAHVVKSGHGWLKVRWNDGSRKTQNVRTKQLAGRFYHEKVKA